MNNIVRILLLASSVQYAFTAVAAQFKPDSGGHLDVGDNWTSTSQADYLVGKAQAAPLTVSCPSATLPGAKKSGSFFYKANAVFTNDFGADRSLDTNGRDMYVEGGATLLQNSGSVTVTGTEVGPYAITATPVGSTMVFAGAGTSLNGKYLITKTDDGAAQACANLFALTNSATATFSEGVKMGGGYDASTVLLSGEGTRLNAKSLDMGVAFDKVCAAAVEGVSRSFVLRDEAEGVFSGYWTLGALSGWNNVAVESGASASLVVLDMKDSGCNTVRVDNATLTVTANMQMASAGKTRANACIAESGAKVFVGADGKARELVLGHPGDGNLLSARGSGTVVTVGALSKLFIGGRNATSIGSYNTVCVEDEASMSVGSEMHMGFGGGVGNRLVVGSDGSFAANGKVFLYSGNEIEVSGGELTVAGAISADSNATVTVENGAKVCFNDAATFEGGGNKIVISGGASLTYQTLNVVGDIVASDATVALTNEMLVTGGTATFTNCNVVMSTKYATKYGGNDFAINFVDSNVAMSNRWDLQGTNFTFMVDNSHVVFEADQPFFTGGNDAMGGDRRRFVFDGADPYLRINGSRGFYMRGAVDLVFNVGEGNFPEDHAVVELGDGAKFDSDADMKSLHTLTVNVDDKCPGGTFTLMKGKNAFSIFSDNESQFIKGTGAARIKFVTMTEDGVEVVKVKVRKNSGLILLFR